MDFGGFVKEGFNVQLHKRLTKTATRESCGPLEDRWGPGQVLAFVTHGLMGFCFAAEEDDARPGSACTQVRVYEADAANAFEMFLR